MTRTHGPICLGWQSPYHCHPLGALMEGFCEGEQHVAANAGDIVKVAVADPGHAGTVTVAPAGPLRTW
jgi:hypothetical protein